MLQFQDRFGVGKGMSGRTPWGLWSTGGGLFLGLGGVYSGA